MNFRPFFAFCKTQKGYTPRSSNLVGMKSSLVRGYADRTIVAVPFLTSRGDEKKAAKLDQTAEKSLPSERRDGVSPVSTRHRFTPDSSFGINSQHFDQFRDLA